MKKLLVGLFLMLALSCFAQETSPFIDNASVSQAQ
jgi:hypothetical protein